MPQYADPKRKAILARIESLEAAIAKSKEYLETGKHADWSLFQPLFTPKVRDGQRLPPHKDWIRNVFLPRTEKALDRAERLLGRLD
ncbi:MAG: hypothetical protein AAF333_03270 [Planctomycetota bacterium]